MARGSNLTLDELAATVRVQAKVEIAKLPWDEFQGVVEHEVADQVVVVRAGTRLSDLNTELAKVGQAVPFADPFFDPKLGAAIAKNMPHLNEGQFGSWRDWVLGMTVIRADGTIAKCGSKAVKNVAGYDVQRLLIGSRGRLAVMAEIILRTYSLASVPRHERFPTPDRFAVQRTQRTDFERAHASVDLIYADERTATIWFRPSAEITRYEHDWLIVSDQPHVPNATVDTLNQRLYKILDPGVKFQ